MSDETRRTLWLLVGTALVLAAVVGLFTGSFEVLGGSSADGPLLLVVLAGFVIAVWRLAREDAGTADRTAQPADPVVAVTPEEAATDDALSGCGLSWLLEEAGEVAREDRTVTAGIEWLRPTLRATLLDALVHEYGDREAAAVAVDEGTWTDDPVAAAVCSDAVPGPSLSFRERVSAWLFPERVLRERVRVTVDEIARAADDALSAVPGERAPRTIPVVTPTVDDLQRTVDGRLDLAAGVAADGRDADGTDTPAAEPSPADGDREGAR